MKMFEQITIVIIIVILIIFLEILTTKNTAYSINKMLDEINNISDLLIKLKKNLKIFLKNGKN